MLYMVALHCFVGRTRFDGTGPLARLATAALAALAIASALGEVTGTSSQPKNIKTLSCG
jgi:hypothetical protein